MKPVMHFVGFRDDRYTAALRVFGPPDFIHPGWDRRARREIMPGDTVVFATGTEAKEPRWHSYPDMIEPKT